MWNYYIWAIEKILKYTFELLIENDIQIIKKITYLLWKSYWVTTYCIVWEDQYSAIDFQ